ncbi:lipoyl(octanoyl) transferase LipB [Candidatus Haliotispira prima]|uniref:Octanoyltransferase n=1 Tax=Candidatus Haliotispira prima TaxID=3034016 RepID=A0ABY8MGV6_9SPIO|nr:lipoyl(octanoyl) transferase LipB [Candidatus Haliotispira prima]
MDTEIQAVQAKDGRETGRNRLAVKYPGRVSYEEGLRLQQEIWQQRVAGDICDTLLLLEHDPVFTMGRRDSRHNMRLPERQLSAPVVRCDRGGEMTYHGPGQLVGYFHAKLSQLDNGRGIGIKELIFRLEETIILLLRLDYGLNPRRDPEHRGVWLESREGHSHNHGAPAAAKIAALGISVRQGVSMHGFALNIITDLSFFQQIVPCGIAGRGVTSLKQELKRGACPQKAAQTNNVGVLPDLATVADQLCRHFRIVFGYA